MAEFVQVLDGEDRTLAVVTDDHVDRLRPDRSTDHDGRRRRTERLDLSLTDRWPDQHGTVHRVAAERVEYGALELQLVAERHQHVEAGLAERCMQAVDDIGEEGVVKIAEQHADRPRRLRGEHPGAGVRHIAERLDRLEDRLAGLVPCAGEVAQGHRHQSPRHPGPFGHVIEGGATHDGDSTVALQ